MHKIIHRMEEIMNGKRPWMLDLRICWTVLVAFSCLSLMPLEARAAMIESRLADESAISERVTQIESIRQVLEHELVAQRLADYGLSAQEISAKLPTLSDEQLHQLASMSQDVAAGDGLGVVIGVLVIVLLVIVILKLMNKEVIIR
jgi:hypothetical protein